MVSSSSVFLVNVVSCDSNGRNCKTMVSIKSWNTNIAAAVSPGYGYTTPSVPSCSSNNIQLKAPRQ